MAAPIIMGAARIAAVGGRRYGPAIVTAAKKMAEKAESGLKSGQYQMINGKLRQITEHGILKRLPLRRK